MTALNYQVNKCQIWIEHLEKMYYNWAKSSPLPSRWHQNMTHYVMSNSYISLQLIIINLDREQAYFYLYTLFNILIHNSSVGDILAPKGSCTISILKFHTFPDNKGVETRPAVYFTHALVLHKSSGFWKKCWWCESASWLLHPGIFFRNKNLEVLLHSPCFLSLFHTWTWKTPESNDILLYTM